MALTSRFRSLSSLQYFHTFAHLIMVIYIYPDFFSNAVLVKNFKRDFDGFEELVILGNTMF